MRSGLARHNTCLSTQGLPMLMWSRGIVVLQCSIVVNSTMLTHRVISVGPSATRKSRVISKLSQLAAILGATFSRFGTIPLYKPVIPSSATILVSASPIDLYLYPIPDMVFIWNRRRRTSLLPAVRKSVHLTENRKMDIALTMDMCMSVPRHLRRRLQGVYASRWGSCRRPE